MNHNIVQFVHLDWGLLGCGRSAERRARTWPPGRRWTRESSGLSNPGGQNLWGEEGIFIFYIHVTRYFFKIIIITEPDVFFFGPQTLHPPPSYLAPSWQTVAVFAGEVTQHQTTPPLLLCTANQTTERTQTKKPWGEHNKTCDCVFESTASVSTLLPTLQWLLSCALYRRWASTILSTMYFCSRVRVADKAWRRGESNTSLNQYQERDVASPCYNYIKCAFRSKINVIVDLNRWGRRVHTCLMQFCSIIQPDTKLTIHPNHQTTKQPNHMFSEPFLNQTKNQKTANYPKTDHKNTQPAIKEIVFIIQHYQYTMIFPVL